MIEKLREIFSIPELRRRILFTFWMLLIYRFGSHIPTAGVDSSVLESLMETQRGTLFGLYDLFAGGAFSKATIFALGIMPYISASIIMQLLTAVVPFFEKLSKEGEEGRQRINQYTRYGTVLLSLIQSYGVAVYVEGMNNAAMGQLVVPDPGMSFRIMTMITMTAGAIFVMWLGEQITEKGIGNGSSLLIFIGILSRYPTDVFNTFQRVKAGTLSIPKLIIILALMALIIGFVIMITQAQRRIPVQYARRVIGRRMYGGQSTHIPLKLATAGVIPIIFAQSIMMFPSTLATFFSGKRFIEQIALLFVPSSWVYNSIYALLIIFFTYFYTAVIFNPVDLADNMKKYGGFIPGVRPGKKTSDFIDRILTRITLPGGLFLAFIAILPTILIDKFGVPFYFGGTGLLIIIGVILDTLQQVESHLVMRHYEGFLKRGRIRGRR